MKTTIKFWGGLRTIGGNIAEITYGKDRIIFDFGLVYDPANVIIDTQQRKQSYVLDMLKLDAIPAIDGIYSKEALTGTSFSMKKPQPEEESAYQTAVFISHLHLDHMGAIDTLSPQISIYMTKGSKQLYDALENIGEGLSVHKETIGMSYGETIQIGEISVTPIQVDHDIVGASSFLIETPDATIVNSGDLRMHGANPEYTEDWLTNMAARNIDALLIEGTTFRPDTNDAETAEESDILVNGKTLLREHNGLGIFNLYHRNIERIHTFLQMAALTGRTPVLEAPTAYLAHQFLADAKFEVFLDGSSKHADIAEQLPPQYDSVTAADINQDPAKYLLQNSFHLIHNLLDLDLKNSIYLHANGMPLGSFDPAYTSMQALLNRFGVTYHSLNVSGHAKKEDILYIIDRIKPHVLIPWHSHHPELIKPLDPKQEVHYPKKLGIWQPTTAIMTD
ncbi:MBL fold metallo-hydrolase [Terribacillus saccharophilus]|uniref:MBL fold metallo-hydrolase n=1 Tax=Terribacillus saccharophilus TaxID=361277 RepID=UPI003982B9CF